MGNIPLMRSTDNGDHWTTILPSKYFPYDRIFSMAQDSAGNLLIGIEGPPSGGIYRSTDEGDSWVPVDTTKGLTVTKIITYKNNIIALSTIGLMRSADNGHSWNLDTLDNIFDIASNSKGSLFLTDGIHPNPATGNLDDGGLYTSSDFGITWKKISDIGRGLVIDSLDFLYTSTCGVLRSATPTTEMTQVFLKQPLSFNSQNYPDPFSLTTNISFLIPKRTFITLRIFNELGSEVAMLANQVLEPGNYSIPFDGANLAQGIYFYRLEAKGISEVKTMLLLK